MNSAFQSDIPQSDLQPRLDQLVNWVAEAIEAGIACGEVHDHGSALHHERFDRMTATCRQLIDSISAAVAQRDAALATLAEVQPVSRSAFGSLTSSSAFAAAKERCQSLFEPLTQPAPHIGWYPTKL